MPRMYTRLGAANYKVTVPGNRLGLGLAAGQQPGEMLVHLGPELGVAEGVDDGVVGGRGFGSHDSAFGQQGVDHHSLIRVEHADSSHHCVRAPAQHEGTDGDEAHLGHLDLGVFVLYGGELKGMIFAESARNLSSVSIICLVLA